MMPAPPRPADDTAAGYCVTPCLDGYSATSRNRSYQSYTGPFLRDLPDQYNTFHYLYINRCQQVHNVQVYNFQQRYNLMGTPIKAMEIGIRAGKGRAAGTDPIIQLRYTLNGGDQLD